MGFPHIKFNGSSRWRGVREAVFERDGWRCYVCGWGPGERPADWNPKYTFSRSWRVKPDPACEGAYITDWNHLAVDHVIPRDKGGWHHMDNLRCICEKCNAGKCNRGVGARQFA